MSGRTTMIKMVDGVCSKDSVQKTGKLSGQNPDTERQGTFGAVDQDVPLVCSQYA